MENRKFTNSREVSKMAQDLFDNMDHVIKKPDYLFHYTSQPAIYDIVTNGELWLSSVKGLNDPLEIVFGLRTIRAILERSQSQYASEIIEIMQKYDTPERDEYYLEYSNPTFLLSLTETEDSLPQWINYGDQGNGVAIKFIRNRFFDTINKHIASNVFAYVYPVCYFDQCFIGTNVRITNFEKLVVDFISEFYSKLVLPEKEQVAEKLLFDYIFIIASLIKTDFHSVENEWRYFLVAPGPGDRNITVVKSGNSLKMVYKIQFREDDTDNLPPQRALGTMVESLVIGPKNSGNTSLKWSLHQLIYRNWARDGGVEYSQGRLRK